MGADGDGDLHLGQVVWVGGASAHHSANPETVGLGPTAAYHSIGTLLIGALKMNFLTVSYRNDLARFLLLKESIDRFCDSDYMHYVVIPKSDEKRFRVALKNYGVGRDNSKLEILFQEDFILNIYYPNLPFSFLASVVPTQSWRFKKYLGRPGWIRQQIIKRLSKN